MTEDKELTCPRDGTPLDPRVYEADVEVDSCASCRGMWLDAGELEAIERSSERDYHDDLVRVADDAVASERMAEQLAQAETAPIACPKCGATLDTREYAYCSQIVIDTCPEGCGVWLDAGEIQAIERFFERARQDADDASPAGARLWASLRSLFKSA